MSVLIKGIDLPEAYTSAWLTVFECVGEHTFVKTHKVSAEQMQAIPPHGRWVPVTNGRGGFECSICHNYAPSYQDGVEWLSLYCPNCGAKMDAEEGETHEIDRC